MHKLVLQPDYVLDNSWNHTLHRMLVESGLFDVSTRDYEWIRVKGARNKYFTRMEVNGCLVGLDTWDRYGPTSSFLDNGSFDNELKDLDLLIKIQWYPCRYWDEFTEKTGIPVKPWTVMPTKNFQLEAFKWQNIVHRYLAQLTGRNNRFGRQPYVQFCADRPELFYTKSDMVSRDSQDSYMKILRQCRWGLILKGLTRRHDGKNRRECEYTSLGIPLAMNYEPHYPFDIIPGIHYIKINTPEDLLKLYEIDPQPFAKASSELYHDRFSPVGMAKTLIDLVAQI